MTLNQSKGNMYPFITDTFNTVKGKCPHDCHYCLDGEVDILMADFTVKKIKSVRQDDKIVGISKYDGAGYYKFGEHKVVNIGKRKAKTIIIKTEHGSIECTKDHPLMGSTEVRNCTDWKSAGAFSVYENLRFIGMSNSPEMESFGRKIGWLAGFCDGDGCFFEHGNKKQYLGFEAVCVDDELRIKFLSACQDFGVYLKEGRKVSSKKSFNKGASSKMVFSRANKTAKSLKLLTRFDDSHSDEYYFGYLAGMLDTDGSVNLGCVRIAQSRSANLVKYNNLKYCCKRLGIKYKEEESGIRLLGGFKTRMDLLFRGQPKHSVKSRRLLYGLGIKGSYHSEIQAIGIGKECDVYNIETTSGNYIANGFIVHNCYMKRFGEQKPVRFDEKELKTDLGSGKFIFVGSSCDMFSNDIPRIWIVKTLEYLKRFDNKYLFQSKDVINLYRWMPALPKNSILGTTIETNRIYSDFMGKTLSPQNRSSFLYDISQRFKTMVTIEPIMDFDVNELWALVALCNPEWVNIGADSQNHNLPEPPAYKIKGLIEKLKSDGIEVKIKKNLSRLLKPCP